MRLSRYAMAGSLAFTLLVFLLVSGVSSCGDKRPAKPELKRARIHPKDTATPKLDSGLVAGLLEKMKLPEERVAEITRFYASRDFAAAWLEPSGPNEYAGILVNLLQNEDLAPGADSSGTADLLNALAHPVGPGRRIKNLHGDPLTLELRLTARFFDYARRNWGGAGDSVLRRVNWFIERKRIDYPELLADFLSSDLNLPSASPVHAQYNLLRENLRRYAQAEADSLWPRLNDIPAGLKNGDSSEVLPAVRQFLYVTGDLGEDNGFRTFDQSLQEAVRQFQLRHGFAGDGVLDEPTLALMRVPIRERIRQILINMERWRWVPPSLTGDLLFVNIPEFRLHVFTNGRLSWTCRTIVGVSDPVFRTVIFHDSLEFIVFNPYWNIPKNIFLKEVLPGIQKDEGYLDKHNMEVVDRKGVPVDASSIRWKKAGEDFPYIVRERPGDRNSLGRVKFLFPNPYEIYFHDTPARDLFNKNSRAFSHGCIRLEDPLRLAGFALRHDSSWHAARIAKTLGSGKETHIRLKRKIPVFIAYFTTWVDRSGKLHFREDIYGHDAEMKRLLFVN